MTEGYNLQPHQRSRSSRPVEASLSTSQDPRRSRHSQDSEEQASTSRRLWSSIRTWGSRRSRPDEASSSRSQNQHGTDRGEVSEEPPAYGDVPALAPSGQPDLPTFGESGQLEWWRNKQKTIRDASLGPIETLQGDDRAAYLEWESLDNEELIRWQNNQQQHPQSQTQWSDRVWRDRLGYSLQQGGEQNDPWVTWLNQMEDSTGRYWSQLSETEQSQWYGLYYAEQAGTGYNDGT